MIDEHYANPKLAAIYESDSGWGEDREYYLTLAPQQAIDILDLGCGTGLLCNAYAAHRHRVVGVDPAQAMLDVARRKPQGASIEWVCATAQDFRSDRRFDLIIMTGNAFQVFLTDDDVAGVLDTMRHHLKPGGRAVFETRNPTIDWARKWQIEIGGIQRLVPISQAKDTLTFDMHYHMADELLTSRSTLRFMSRTEIEKLLRPAGLKALSVKGDWNSAEFDEKTSEEMVFEVALS